MSQLDLDPDAFIAEQAGDDDAGGGAGGGAPGPMMMQSQGQPSGVPAVLLIISACFMLGACAFLFMELREFYGLDYGLF